MKLSLSKRLLFAGTAMLLALGVVEGFLALVGVGQSPTCLMPTSALRVTRLCSKSGRMRREAVDADRALQTHVFQ